METLYQKENTKIELYIMNNKSESFLGEVYCVKNNKKKKMTGRAKSQQGTRCVTGQCENASGEQAGERTSTAGFLQVCCRFEIFT